jgi:hypothetical protein
MKNYSLQVVLGDGVSVILIATGLKVLGFKPGQGR